MYADADCAWAAWTEDDNGSTWVCQRGKSKLSLESAMYSSGSDMFRGHCLSPSW